MIVKNDIGKVPRHIAIIMDGNGRWAKSKGLPRTFGHRKGVSRVKEIVREAKKSGVKVLTLFAFSTENWSRPKAEINVLFSYLDKFLSDYKNELIREDIRLRFIGRRDKFTKKTLDKIEELEEVTKKNESFNIVVALDYGGRWDIVNAFDKIYKRVIKGDVSISDITEESFGGYLALRDFGDPELLIRTSGEQRISNFLLWNTAYSELYFTDIAWPDFDKKQFQLAIDVYHKRKRRFGGVDE